jgi:hypothetical protein
MNVSVYGWMHGQEEPRMLIKPGVSEHATPHFIYATLRRGMLHVLNVMQGRLHFFLQQLILLFLSNQVIWKQCGSNAIHTHTHSAYTRKSNTITQHLLFVKWITLIALLQLNPKKELSTDKKHCSSCCIRVTLLWWEMVTCKSSNNETQLQSHFI